MNIIPDISVPDPVPHCCAIIKRCRHLQRPLVGKLNKKWQKLEQKNWDRGAAAKLKRRDIVAEVVRGVSERCSSAASGICDKKATLNPDLLPPDDYNPSITYDAAWAQPQSSSTGKYGENWMTDEIIAWIVDMYENGTTTKSARKSEWQLHEDLKAMYPHKFCLPTAHTIQTWYINLGQRTKKTGSARRSSPNSQPKLPQSVSDFIDTSVRRDINVKPSSVFNSAEEQFPALELKKFKRKITTKVSSLKQKLKKPRL